MYKNAPLKVDEEKGQENPSESYITVMSFYDGDLENPYNWSLGKKIYILLCGIVAVVDSTLGSSLPCGAINYIGPYFNVTSDQQLVLPFSLSLVGYVLGPIFFGP
ncbi:hypothetical protein N7G274_008272 [Stereocaulon virgatum]|uniref:Uncharacterized protein n=1 Tax=Stereocaulon virgatum TaxID=373712 RepID=A0ABR3ZZ12_9LECA